MVSCSILLCPIHVGHIFLPVLISCGRGRHSFHALTVHATEEVSVICCSTLCSCTWGYMSSMSSTLLVRLFVNTYTSTGTCNQVKWIPIIHRLGICMYMQKSSNIVTAIFRGRFHEVSSDLP